MKTRSKKTIGYISIVLCAFILLLLLLGFALFPRANLPKPVSGNYCNQHNIRIDGTSIETIYLSPESILQDPEGFLQEDPAYRLFGMHRAKMVEPFPLEKWLGNIKNLASQPLDRREKERPFRLYSLIMANQESFCQEVGTHVLAYLPEGIDLETTIYLTALEGSAAAFAANNQVVFSLSHPLLMGTAWLYEPTALSSFYNLALHELFHIGFSHSFTPPSLEEHMENEVVIDMLIALQNEGVATYISYKLNPIYPSPFEWTIYLVDRESVVRLYIKEMNKLFAIARTKPTGEAYDDIYRRISALGYRRMGFYIVGAHMAMTIEEELGKEALIQTVSNGYYAFADTYNRIAEKDLQMQWAATP